MKSPPDWAKPWPTTPYGQMWLNLVLAWLWFVFGLYGLAELAGWVPHNPISDDKVATSIACLFFISVYANFVGHLSTSQAAKAEEKVNG